MRYEIIETLYYKETLRSVQTTADDIHFVSFPADQSNADYVQFLVDAQLTDTEVHALTPDVWHDFPKETN